MSKVFMFFSICFLIFIKLGVNKICSYLEELDGTMQQVHMELYKLRMGAEEEWSNTI